MKNYHYLAIRLHRVAYKSEQRWSASRAIDIGYYLENKRSQEIPIFTWVPKKMASFYRRVVLLLLFLHIQRFQQLAYP